MKLQIGLISTILTATTTTTLAFFSPPSSSFHTTTTTTTTANTKNHHNKKSSIISFATNVLEGKEISNDFTPINNMLLVKKGEIIDQTSGGIFLTGKVSNEMYIIYNIIKKG